MTDIEAQTEAKIEVAEAQVQEAAPSSRCKHIIWILLIAFFYLIPFTVRQLVEWKDVTFEYLLLYFYMAWALFATAVMNILATVCMWKNLNPWFKLMGLMPGACCLAVYCWFGVPFFF